MVKSSPRSRNGIQGNPLAFPVAAGIGEVKEISKPFPSGRYIMGPRRIRIACIATMALFCLTMFGCSDETDPVDLGPPYVTRVSPLRGAENVDVNTSLVITFSEQIDLSTLSDSTFSLVAGGEKSAWAMGKAAGSLKLEYTPLEPLAFETLYEATVDSSLADLDGNTLAADFSWTFTTEQEPPPPVEFPLAQENAWIYAGTATSTVWTASGSSTSSFDGLRILYVERPANYEGRDCWLMRSFSLDQTITPATALQADYF